jgi:hypothetical protein
MDCHFTPHGDLFKCSACGTLKRRVSRRVCPVGGGLGDAVAAVASKIGIRSCGGCKKRQSWLNRVTPWRKRADVAIVFHSSVDPGWLETRGDLVGNFLEENGRSAFVVGMNASSEADLREVLKTLRPRLLINRAFFIKQEMIENAAAKFKRTRFLTVNHSSYAYTQDNDGSVREQAAAIELAARRENCFLAHVDERDVLGLMGLRRCLYFPNVVTTPEVEPKPLESLERPLVSICGRWNLVKNQIQQMIAIKLVGDARALLVMKGRENLQEITAKSIGLEYELQPWQNWREWHRTINERVAVGMQASFSESFNYVALEHLQLGRPVVGSSAVRYLPDSWKADPDSPHDMARVLDNHLANYSERSEQAKAIAEKVKTRNNTAFLETIGRLLDKKAVF